MLTVVIANVVPQDRVKIERVVAEIFDAALEVCSPTGTTSRVLPDAPVVAAELTYGLRSAFVYACP